MDKFMEFLKNNTAVVAVAAGIVLFIAMNGITSCVAKGGGNDAPADAHGQLEQKSEQSSHKGDAADSKTELTERQPLPNRRSCPGLTVLDGRTFEIEAPTLEDALFRT